MKYFIMVLLIILMVGCNSITAPEEPNDNTVDTLYAKPPPEL